MPDLPGKIAVITGANSGTGYEATRALARNDVHVVMACRSLEKAEAAADRIREESLDASIEIMQLDLADLSSVRGFTHEFSEHHQSLHILLNNAGIMMPPKRQTADGFELQFGVNHLGHFALTGLLMKQIMNSVDSRIVTMSSSAHSRGSINFDDLNWENSYGRTGAYAQSKLANLLFAYELQRRLEAAGSRVLSLASHPGWSATNLQSTGMKMGGGWIFRLFLGVGNRLIAQKAAMGALPMLYAATAPDVESGAYYGPDGWREIRGFPKKATSSESSHDEELARRLWDVSEELTRVRYEALQS